MAGLLVTTAATVAAYKTSASRERQSFRHATDIELQAVRDHFATYTALLRGAAGLFAASHDDVPLMAFRAYVERLDLTRRYPGFLAVGFTPVVPRARSEELTASMQAQKIVEFTIHPASNGEMIAPVAYAEPANARNRAAIGYDVLTNPLRREMVERARDTGLSAASARLQLEQEINTEKQAGFLVATPLYANGTVPLDVTSRRAAFRGFVFGAFRADDLFASIIAAGVENEAALVVYDGPPSEAHLLHRSLPSDARAGAADLRRVAQLEIGGRTWHFEFTSRPSPDRASTGRDTWLIGGGGTLGTMLLSAAALRQRRTQRNVIFLNASLEARVAERTRDLLDAIARLQKAGDDRLTAEAQLRQSQKMEAVGQLTGGLAHDFNNLLTAIMGSLELLGLYLAKGDSRGAVQYVATAQDAAGRAAALTHRLLAFARKQTLDPHPTDINSLVTGMEELIRRTMGPAISIEIVLAQNLWLTLCDSSQLENALLNLCINARDAMHEGGRLLIATSNVAAGEEHRSGSDWPSETAADFASGAFVRMRVADTGTGMTADTAARAYDPFFTTKPLGQGTGLGLSMIYGFARQSGGRTRIHSALNEGTSVEIDLPRALDKVDPSNSTKVLLESTRLNAVLANPGQAVLVVDDEAAVRSLVSEVLERRGFHVMKAQDGPSGLVHLRSPNRIDLLVTDVGMPGGMNGRQLADAARRLRPGLKVLFITGYAEDTVLAADTLDTGMGLLVKPFALEALAARVCAMLVG